MHFIMPIYSHVLSWMGGVEGTLRDTLMRQGYPILVYPGGSREVMRKKVDEPYTLHWGEVYVP